MTLYTLSVKAMCVYTSRLYVHFLRIRLLIYFNAI